MTGCAFVHREVHRYVFLELVRHVRAAFVLVWL
jgi:hypothetical protein